MRMSKSSAESTRPYQTVRCVQEFYGHFQELEGPKRLLGFSKSGQKHYATPGEQRPLYRYLGVL